MLNFCQNALDQTVCVMVNSNGSRTVIAVLEGKDWRVTPDAKMNNQVCMIGLISLIDVAYQAVNNVLFFRDIMSKRDIVTMKD